MRNINLRFACSWVETSDLDDRGPRLRLPVEDAKRFAQRMIDTAQYNPTQLDRKNKGKFVCNLNSKVSPQRVSPLCISGKREPWTIIFAIPTQRGYSIDTMLKKTSSF